MLESPLLHGFEIFALMLRVEVRICDRIILIPPSLAQHANVNSAHQVLSQDIMTMGYELPISTLPNDPGPADNY